MTPPFFLLASRSPRRQSLLTLLDIPFEVCPADVDESIPDGEEPKAAAKRIALEKARAVARRYPNRLVVGADTVVVIDGVCLGKPGDLLEAAAMLRRLSGHSHLVVTGVALVHHAIRKETTFVETTRVTFRSLTRKMIDYYVTHYPPLDKAGAYGIQDWSACFVDGIEGCYQNVVGFPIARFVRVISDPRFRRRFRLDNWLEKAGQRP